MISTIEDIQNTFNCDEEQAKDIKKIIEDIFDEKFDKEFNVPF